MKFGENTGCSGREPFQAIPVEPNGIRMSDKVAKTSEFVEFRVGGGCQHRGLSPTNRHPH